MVCQWDEEDDEPESASIRESEPNRFHALFQPISIELLSFPFPPALVDMTAGATQRDPIKVFSRNHKEHERFLAFSV
jgi:hypothetical protein